MYYNFLKVYSLKIKRKHLTENQNGLICTWKLKWSFKFTNKLVSTWSLHGETGRKVGEANQVGIHLCNQDSPTILIHNFCLHLDVDKFSIRKLHSLLLLACYYIYTSNFSRNWNLIHHSRLQGKRGRGRTSQDFIGEKVRRELSKLHQPHPHLSFQNSSFFFFNSRNRRG